MEKFKNCMSKKSFPFILSEFSPKIGQDFLASLYYLDLVGIRKVRGEEFDRNRRSAVVDQPEHFPILPTLGAKNVLKVFFVHNCVSIIIEQGWYQKNPIIQTWKKTRLKWVFTSSFFAIFHCTSSCWLPFDLEYFSALLKYESCVKNLFLSLFY